ncbi:MAG: LysR family transcriptional regulator [Oligoflexia bacterium]|nr:LysR family transcriptional regulator [Oligoflexia bacterium]
MELDGIPVFVKVVQAGSFSRAARQLGMPKTTVSAKVARLERRLGVTLIQRTTRQLNVTPAGRAYFERCVRGLEEIQAAESEIANVTREPRGLLRITAPVDVAHSFLPAIVRRYLAKYPETQVELIVTNRMVDLVSEGVDLAIRAGELEDSSLLARKFVSSSMVFWASPAYLKRKGAPKHPRELAQHDCLVPSDLPHESLKLTAGSEEFVAKLTGRVAADDFETLKAFIVKGDGIGLLPDYLAAEAFEAGKLERILPRWSWGTGVLSFVYPAQRFVSPKVQAFIALATGK